MNDDTRRVLYRFLDEKCGHENKQWFTIPCPKCDPRTFDNPADAQVVKDKLVEKGLWLKFDSFAWAIYRHSAEPPGVEYMDWLWSYTRDENGQITGYRLCDLAGEFVEVGG